MEPFIASIVFFRIAQKKKLKKEYENVRVCNDHDYCYVEMPNREKSMKAPFVFHFDLECLFEIMYSCQNNSEKS